MVKGQEKCKGIGLNGRKSLQLWKKGEAMYRGKDREETYLFKELQPFGGQLEEGNRWLRIKGLIPWGELERTYVLPSFF